jgi:hypothetical protein
MSQSIPFGAHATADALARKGLSVNAVQSFISQNREASMHPI